MKAQGKPVSRAAVVEIYERTPMTARLLWLKRLIATCLQSRPIGDAIAWLYGDVIPFHGIRIDVRGAGIPAGNKAALRWGMYESAEYRFVKKYVRPNLPVVELGSSIGAISSVIARQMSPGQRLTCVEANRSLIPTLERNLRVHAGHLSVQVVHAAVAYDSDCVRFGVSANNLISSLPAGSGVEGDVVPGVTLSSLVAPLRGNAFQLVADIEGAELDVLVRDVDALRTCQVLVIELHDTRRNGHDYTRKDLRQLLDDTGFECVAQYGSVVACRKPVAAEDS